MMVESKRTPSVLSAIFLVSGTSVGAGMLAQPVVASLAGFFPALAMMAVAWLFMTSTALLLVEVCLWMDSDTHIISMAGRFLGTPGKVVAWILFLFIAYFSLSAYVSGAGDIFSDASERLFANPLPDWISCLLFVFIFGLAIEIGGAAVGKINSLLFFALLVIYFLIIVLGFKGVNAENLIRNHWEKALVVVPILLTSFSFQMIVPNLVSYLKRDRTRIRWAIIAGTATSFLVYLLWILFLRMHVAFVFLSLIDGEKAQKTSHRL